MLASLAAVAMIFAARVLHEKTPEIQEPRIITFLADTSYAVYLFHWPFYIIFSQLMSNLPAVILTIIFSYFFAILSFYIVEPLIAGKSNPLIRKISRLPHIKPISAAGAGILTLIALIIIAVAPQVGAFETGLMVNGFKQAQTNIGQTKTLAEQAELSRLGISEGTSLIGDSVALRANTALQEALPEANINAQVSRTTKQANDIMLNNSQNKALLKTVVIATGVNNPEGYKNDLDSIVNNLPKGHHLILVTPYEGDKSKDTYTSVEQYAAYARELAEKNPYVSIADWNKVAKEHPEIWAGTDQVHFGNDNSKLEEGAKLYAETIAAAVKAAQELPVKSK
ncbi:O-acetyltransferase OatA [Streptococcus oralis]|nr:O-acetyltransferase OatA [Streptococcus oralis]